MAYEKENNFKTDELKAAQAITERERMNRVAEFYYDIPKDLLSWLRSQDPSGEGKYIFSSERIVLPKDPQLKKDLLVKLARATEAMIESKAPRKKANTMETIIKSKEKRILELQEMVKSKNENLMIQQLRSKVLPRLIQKTEWAIHDFETERGDMERRLNYDPIWLTLIQDIEIAIRNAQLAMGTSSYEDLLERKEKTEKEWIIRE